MSGSLVEIFLGFLMSEQEVEYLSVGWVSDAHGLRGESYIRLYTSQPDWLERVDQFRLLSVTQGCKDRLKKKNKSLEVKANEVLNQLDYSLVFKKPHKQGLRVKFKEVKDRTEAEALKGFIVQVPKADLVSENDDEFFFHEIMEFSVFDQYKKNCGSVESHYNNGAHDILILKNNFSSKEVPFVQDWIVKIDFKNKEIFMKLPDGLFEL